MGSGRTTADMLTHPRRVRFLYKTVLRLHRGLPPALRELGTLRVWVLIFLLTSPASAVPLKKARLTNPFLSAIFKYSESSTDKTSAKNSLPLHQDSGDGTQVLDLLGSSELQQPYKYNINFKSVIRGYSGDIDFSSSLYQTLPQFEGSVPHAYQPIRLKASLREPTAWNPEAPSSILAGGEGLYMDDTDRSSSRGRRETPSDEGSGESNWMKPCPNIAADQNANATPAQMSEEILKAISKAYSQFFSFINSYSAQVLQKTWSEAVMEVEDKGYSLPFLNNSDDTSRDLTKPDSLSFKDSLLGAYELIQRRAVGIEQVTLDQALYQSSFLNDFRHMEERIVQILCELRWAMVITKVDPGEGIPKDIMEDTIRDMDDEAGRKIRDTVILKDYINGLETLHNLFLYFKT